jgi:hypothetical protein
MFAWRLSIAERKEVPITFAFCYAHVRRKLFELADIQKSAQGRKCRASRCPMTCTSG